MTLSEYKKMITLIFRENTYRGFADWRHCGRLERELSSFLLESSATLLLENRDKDLFDITCRAFVKWGDTDKDDSNGETQDFVRQIFRIWDTLYERESASLSHKKMFSWFMSKMDGSLMDYMEEFVLEYVMNHFKEPDFLVDKLDFLYQRIAELTEKAKDDSWLETEIEICQRMVLQIMCEQKRPIEFIRSYAKNMQSQMSKALLADIELKYGNINSAIAIYEKLAMSEIERAWCDFEYNNKLKELYKKCGLEAKYKAQVRKLLYLNAGEEAILREYKAFIPTEEWERVRDELFDSFKPNDWRVLPWYKAERCYDRLMDGVEACGYEYLKQYAKFLEDKYPERCLMILSKTAQEDIVEANKRSDYQHVVRILRWMRKYPSGKEKAAELASEFRAKYPRRSAMLEELEGI